MKSLVLNLETKNSEAQYLIESFRRFLEGERMGKLMRELFSIGVPLSGVDEGFHLAEFKGVF